MERTLQIDVNQVIDTLKNKLADALLESAVYSAKVSALEAELDKALALVQEQGVRDGCETKD